MPPGTATRTMAASTQEENMTSRVLVACATKKGSTREVAETIADVLRGQGSDADVVEAGAVDDPDSYDAVVLGGAIYMGRWHRDALRLLERHRKTLAGMPVFVFGMGPRTLAEDEVAGSRLALDIALAKVPEVEPLSLAIFGGVVDPAKLRFPFSRMPASDARDWHAIRDWADAIGSRLAGAPAGAAR